MARGNIIVFQCLVNISVQEFGVHSKFGHPGGRVQIGPQHAGLKLLEGRPLRVFVEDKCVCGWFGQCSWVVLEGKLSVEWCRLLGSLWHWVWWHWDWMKFT